VGKPVLDEVTAPLERAGDPFRRGPRWASQKMKIGDAREGFEAQLWAPDDQPTTAFFRRHSEIFRDRWMIEQITTKREGQTRNLITPANRHHAGNEVWMANRIAEA
jgi:hypothetical protein